MKAISLLWLCFVFKTNSHSQTLGRWAQAVDWDGVSHWSRYMKTLPAFQGPNALPVPTLGNGTVDSITHIGLTANLHFSPGDNTQNFRLHANYCLVKHIVAFDISWIPFEHFVLSDAVKSIRHVYSEFYNDHTTVGDVYFNTTIQLLNKWRKYIHLALRMGYRFPSGGEFGAARYVDGPGYYFDLSFGKPLTNTALKWMGMAGFYVWQIESDSYNQDDAFLFGTGLEWNKKDFRLQTSVCGYLGWMYKGGDKPIVFRTNFEKRYGKTGLILGFQQGLHDFKYSSLEAGIQYHFTK